MTLALAIGASVAEYDRPLVRSVAFVVTFGIATTAAAAYMVRHPDDLRPLVYSGLYLGGGIVYVTRVPERCCPRTGRIGASHQWWHLAAAAGHILQYLFNASMYDARNAAVDVVGRA